MTLEELLDCSADKLEAMSDKELLEHFQKYLTVTRPELAKLVAKPETQHRTAVSPQPSRPPLDPKKLKALQALGGDIDLDFLKRRMRNK